MELNTTPNKEIHLSLRLREGESFPEGHRVMERPNFSKGPRLCFRELETETVGK